MNFRIAGMGRPLHIPNLQIPLLVYLHDRLVQFPGEKLVKPLPAVDLLIQELQQPVAPWL